MGLASQPALSRRARFAPLRYASEANEASQNDFMVIKYSDKFESIFYAVLCSNITGYFLVPKNQPLGLFEDEEYLDIDKANWQQIMNEHDRKFGEIRWFNYDKKFIAFKDNINLALRFWQPFKYKAVIDIIRIAIKFGLKFIENDDCVENKYLQGIIKQINNEISAAVGYLNLMPASKNKDKFLLGEYNEESRIGDLVLQKLQQKYFDYNFILRSPKLVYLSYGDKIFIWVAGKFDPNISLAKLLELIYQEKILKINDREEKPVLGLDFMTWPNLAFN